MRKTGVRKCMLARGWHIHFLTPVFLITFVHPRVHAVFQVVLRIMVLLVWRKSVDKQIDAAGERGKERKVGWFVRQLALYNAYALLP